MSELLALAERVEALSGPDKDVDEAILEYRMRVEQFVPDRAVVGYPKFAYTGSLDAATSLLPAGGVWRKYTDHSASVYAASPYNAQAQVRYDGTGATPALQIVAAVFRMRAAQEAARLARAKPRAQSTPGVAQG